MSQASKVASSVFGPALLGLCVSFAATGYMGCKKDEPPPPLPSAAPTPVAAPTPTAPVELVPDVAPSASVAEPVKKPGTGAPAQSFAKCCSALLQNAASAPEPNKTYLTQAAGLCSNMVAAGKSGPGLVSAVQGLLRGVGMPSACL